MTILISNTQHQNQKQAKEGTIWARPGLLPNETARRPHAALANAHATLQPSSQQPALPLWNHAPLAPALSPAPGAAPAAPAQAALGARRDGGARGPGPRGPRAAHRAADPHAAPVAASAGPAADQRLGVGVEGAHAGETRRWHGASESVYVCLLVWCWSMCGRLR